MTVAAAVAERVPSQDVSAAQGQRGKTAKTSSDSAEQEFRDVLSSVSEDGRDAAGSTDISEAGSDAASQSSQNVSSADQGTEDVGESSQEQPASQDKSSNTALANALQMIGAALGLSQNHARASARSEQSASQHASSDRQQMPSALALDEALGRLRSADVQQSGQMNAAMAPAQAPEDAMPEVSATAATAASAADVHEAAVSVQRKESHHAPVVSVAPESPHGAPSGNIGADGSPGGSSQGNRNAASEAAPSSGKDALVDAGAQSHLVRDAGRPAQQGIASPAEQIGEGILKELGSGSRNEMRADATPAPTSRASTLGGVKVLHIQLQPADLGTVSVRIALKNDTVDVQLEVSHAETASLVRKHHETLADMLRSAGYTADRIGIQVADIDKSSTFLQQSNHQSAQSQQQNSSQAQGGWQGSSAHAGDNGREARRNGERDVESSDRPGNASAEADNAKISSGAVYI